MPTYDTASKLVILDAAPVGGISNINVQRDLYSDAKVQWLNNSSLNKFIFPWVPVGGQVLPSGSVVPRFFFLKAPWTIRPYEEDHALNLEGNIFREDGAKLTSPTLGDYTVEVNVLTDVGPQDPFGATAVGAKTFADVMVEIYKRLDLDPTAPNTHWQDSSRITNNDDIDLVSTDNGDGTFTVQRQ